MTIQSTNQFYRMNQLDGLSALDANIYQQSFPKHYHDTYQITLAKRSLFKNKINDKTLLAFKNHVSITHPGEVHATICDEKTGHSFFTLYLPPTILQYRSSQTENLQFNTVISDQKLSQLLHKIQKHLSSKSTAIELITWQIIDRLIQYHQNFNVIQSESSTSLDLAELITEYTDFSLENWANRFNLDKFKFLRLFKNQTGMTPNQYSILQRIKASQTRLAQGADLTDCALEFGFYDLPHFHKHFKNIIGVTPKIYQQAHTR